MSSPRKWTIYGLLHPATLAIHYVGQTATPKRRSYEHARNSRLAAGLAPVFSVLQEVDSLDEALLAEENWIQCGFASGWPLTNRPLAKLQKEPSITFSVRHDMLERLRRVYASELADRPGVSFSEVLREVLDNGLRTLEPVDE